MTNQKFVNGYEYFNTIFIYAGNTILKVYSAYLAILGLSCIYSIGIDRIPGPNLLFYCEA